jgi:hypothetical protein
MAIPIYLALAVASFTVILQLVEVVCLQAISCFLITQGGLGRSLW